MAFKLKKPAEAKMKKKNIFMLRDSGGFYEEIFSEKLDPEELLLSFFVYNWIKSKIRDFIKNYENLPEMEKKRLELRRAFLPHADTQLTAMFGKTIEFKYPEVYQARNIYDSLKSNPRILEKVYEKLVDILEIVIRQAKMAQGEKFNPRNYLVDSRTYEVIEKNLLLYREAILPLLQSL